MRVSGPEKKKPLLFFDKFPPSGSMPAGVFLQGDEMYEILRTGRVPLGAPNRSFSASAGANRGTVEVGFSPDVDLTPGVHPGRLAVKAAGGRAEISLAVGVPDDGVLVLALIHDGAPGSFHGVGTAYTVEGNRVAIDTASITPVWSASSFSGGRDVFAGIYKIRQETFVQTSGLSGRRDWYITIVHPDGGVESRSRDAFLASVQEAVVI
jgi:hypothetical protein